MLHELCLYWQATRYNLSAGFVTLQHKTRKGAKRLGGTESPETEAIAVQEPRDSAELRAPQKAGLLPRKSLPTNQVGPPTVCKGNEEWTRQEMIMNGCKWWDMFGIGLQKASHLHITIALSILCVAGAYLFMTC